MNKITKIIMLSIYNFIIKIPGVPSKNRSERNIPSSNEITFSDEACAKLFNALKSFIPKLWIK